MRARRSRRAGGATLALATVAAATLAVAGCAAPAGPPTTAASSPAASSAAPLPAPSTTIPAGPAASTSGNATGGGPAPSASATTPAGPKALANATFPARVGDYTRQGGETPGRDARSATYTAWHVTIHARLQTMPFDSAVGVLDQPRRTGPLTCGLDLSAGTYTCLGPLRDGSLRVDSASVQSLDILLGFTHLLYATFP